MRLPIPDPRDALALAAGGPALLAQLAGALPRVLDLLDDAEALVKRAHRLVDDIDQTRQDADQVVKRTDETIDSAHDMIGRIGGTIDRADALIVRTAGTVGSAEPTLARADKLIDDFAPSLERLRPALEFVAETTEKGEVQALVSLIDHVPHLVERLDTEIVPMLGTLQTVAPDIHDMLDLIAQLNEMLAKVPGLGRVKSRIDEQQAVEASLKAAEMSPVSATGSQD